MIIDTIDGKLTSFQNDDEFIEMFALAAPGKELATLRTDAPLFDNSETLRWHGATRAFAA